MKLIVKQYRPGTSAGRSQSQTLELHVRATDVMGVLRFDENDPGVLLLRPHVSTGYLLHLADVDQTALVLRSLS